jgi:hypothetical protein
MKTEKIVMIERKRVIVTCDVCGKEIPTDRKSYTCGGCLRDVCQNCAVVGVTDIFDLKSYDDYCKSCHAVLDTFRDSVEAIHENYNQDVGRARRGFYAACLRIGAVEDCFTRLWMG